jgi:hypothetical protein
MAKNVKRKRARKRSAARSPDYLAGTSDYPAPKKKPAKKSKPKKQPGKA